MCTLRVGCGVHADMRRHLRLRRFEALVMRAARWRCVGDERLVDLGCLAQALCVMLAEPTRDGEGGFLRRREVRCGVDADILKL